MVAAPVQLRRRLRRFGPRCDARPRGAPFTVEDLVAHQTRERPTGVPGRTLRGRYVQRETDLRANKARTSLWLLDRGAAGCAAQRLTDATRRDSSPRWGPDSRTLFFLSTALGQLAGVAAVARRGNGAEASPTIRSMSARSGCRRAATCWPSPWRCFRTARRSRARAHVSMRAARSKASGRIYERVFVRHWDTWSNGTRAHLFSATLPATASRGAPVDVARGLDADIPGKPFGADEDFAFSPDGRTLVFSARIAGRSEPWSTNFDLYQAPVDGSARR